MNQAIPKADSTAIGSGISAPDGAAPPPDDGAPTKSDLCETAAAIAQRLPSGWTAEMRNLTRGQGELAGQVWDLGSLQGATSIYALDEAAILSGPQSARLLAVRQPGNRNQLLVGALRPASLSPEVLAAHGDQAVPWAIAVSSEPARAAGEIHQRFLPRYRQAYWQVRVRALAAAADGIGQALADWDAVSDSLCDAEGWPLDDAVYSAGKITRDARAWEQVETFLALGPDLLDEVRGLLVDDDRVSGPLSEDLQRMSGIDATLARAAAVREEWEQVTALMDAIMPGLTEADVAEAAIARNEDGWSCAYELSLTGAALASAAEQLTDRVSAERSSGSRRSRAALSRSGAAPATSPVIKTTPAASPSPAARRSR